MNDTSPPELHRLAEPASAVGDLLAAQARKGGSIVVTGGSTPAPAYEHAARVEQDWSKTTLWWTDERCVPPEDERSNYRLVRETLLERVATPPGHVHRIHGELEPADGAGAYD